MNYAQSTKKDTGYTAVNQIIQPKRYSGLSLMPPGGTVVQAKAGWVGGDGAPNQLNGNGLPENI